MTRKMVVNAVDPEEVRIAVLNDARLEEFDIETQSVEKNKGNIYKAIVMAVEPALNAAFIDYGAEKQGFLTANDVDPRLGGHGEDDRVYRINELLRPKQQILVQVTKDEVGAKGAVLTTYLSLAGRYVVLMPGSARHGVSRKIEDEDTRRKMREAADMLDVPENMGVIVRTAGKDRSRVELNRDLKFLSRLWDNIQRTSDQSKAPALIFKEQDVVIRALRDYYSDDVDEIILDSDDAYDRAREYMEMVMPGQRSVLTRYVERRPIFHHYRIEEQLEQLYAHKVPLPSGGSLVIEPTEALVSIDVNSGKQKLGGQEETALQTNLEAAREVARQLRLRDLGGIIVVDFIDMASRKHEARVEKAMKQALLDDKARIKVGRISPNGTLELTRQRIKSALEVSMFQSCSACHGTGHVLKPEAHTVAVLRRLHDRASRGDLKSAKVRVHPQTANILKTDKWKAVQDVESRYNIRVDIVLEHSFLPGQDDFTFETDPTAKPLPIEEPNFGPAPRFDEEGNLLPPEVVAAQLKAERAPQDLDEDELLERAGVIMVGGESLGEEEEDDGRRRGRRGRRGRREGREEGRRDGREGREGREEGRRAAGEGGDMRPTSAFGMPTFELVDPAELGLRPAEADAAEVSNQDEEDLSPEGRRRRGRRGGRRRRGGRERGPGMPGEVAVSGNITPMPSAAGQSASAPATGAMAGDSPQKKPGFFARLFGRS